MHGDVHLPVPRGSIAWKDDRHRRALVALVVGDREQHRSRIARLREHEVGRLREVVLVLALLRRVTFHAAVQPDVRVNLKVIVAVNEA